jgi:NAD-dependent dihydropyrimidine dehydrogenase PreA subunit
MGLSPYSDHHPVYIAPSTIGAYARKMRRYCALIMVRPADLNPEGVPPKVKRFRCPTKWRSARSAPSFAASTQRRRRHEQEGGKLSINLETCTGCSLCILACPVDVIRMDAATDAKRSAW